MTVLFITEQGSRITRSGYSLVLKKEGQRIFLYPLEQISQLVVLGRVEVTTGMMGYLMGRGIDTVFLTADGRFKGRISGATSKNIPVREGQFALRRQPEKVLDFSRRIVLAKIRNTGFALRKTSHSVWEELQPRLKNALKSVERATGLEMLRGLEGSFANLYFSVFPRLLRHAYGFTRRVKHPPTDPVNILLSFGYTLLFNTLYALVEAAGMDPYAGFFHQTRYGHPALVSDLMEPFRANVVDRLIIGLINNHTIREDDFTREGERLILSETAIKRFVKAYRTRLFTPRKSGERKMNLWQMLQKETWNVQKYFKGEQDEYQPYLFR